MSFLRSSGSSIAFAINGLPFLMKRPTGYGDIENLDHYYQDCVIGGPGAFIVPVRQAHDFVDAIRTKVGS